MKGSLLASKVLGGQWNSDNLASPVCKGLIQLGSGEEASSFFACLFLSLSESSKLFSRRMVHFTRHDSHHIKPME